MRALLSWSAFGAADGWQATTSASEGTFVTTLLGPETSIHAPFTEAIPSWVAATPLGSWIEVQLRARRAGHWSRVYRIAQWDARREHSVRRTFDTQEDDAGRVYTDTLALAAPCDALQARVSLHTVGANRPELRALRVALSGPGEQRATSSDFAPGELAIPPRSQKAYPNGSDLCSPTSLTMVLAYWYAKTHDERLAPFAERIAVSELVAPQVYDPVYDGYGNWAFNTAFAASLGLDAYVARFDNLAQLVPWIAAGVPVVISASWENGALENAPIESTPGHLMVVAGFDGEGHALVAEPRALIEHEVRRRYDLAQLETAWQSKSKGTAYLVHPPAWPVPALPVT
jgi:hypothetical protein